MFRHLKKCKFHYQNRAGANRANLKPIDKSHDTGLPSQPTRRILWAAVEDQRKGITGFASTETAPKDFSIQLI